MAKTGRRASHLAAATVLVASLCAGLFMSPAQATDRDYPLLPLSVDGFKIWDPIVDFGNGNLGATGRPTSDGYIVWMHDPADGSWWPSLQGRLFINNAAGLCARMVLQYRRGTTVIIAERRGGTVCAPDNGVNSWSVNLMPYGSEDIDSVSVKIESVASNGVSTTLAESVFLMGPLP